MGKSNKKRKLCRKTYRRKVSRRKVSRRSYKKQRKKRTNKRQSGGSFRLSGLCADPGSDSPYCEGELSTEALAAIQSGNDAMEKADARRRRETAEESLFKGLKKECEERYQSKEPCKGTTATLISALIKYYREELERVDLSTEGELHELRSRFEEYGRETLDDLKKECETLGISSRGPKGDIIPRLGQHYTTLLTGEGVDLHTYRDLDELRGVYSELEQRKREKSARDRHLSEEGSRSVFAMCMGDGTCMRGLPTPVIKGCKELRRTTLQLTGDCFYQGSLSVLNKSYDLLFGLDERFDAVLTLAKELSEIQDYRGRHNILIEGDQTCVDLSRLQGGNPAIFEGINGLYQMYLVINPDGVPVIIDISADGELIHATDRSGELALIKNTKPLFVRSDLAGVVRDYTPEAEEAVEEYTGLSVAALKTLVAARGSAPSPEDSRDTLMKKLMRLEKGLYRKGEEKGLAIEVGDTVVVIDDSDEDLWVGYVLGNPSEKGSFPSDCVEMKPLPSKSKFVLNEGGYDELYILACLNYAFTPYLKTVGGMARAEVDTKVLYIPNILPAVINKLEHLIPQLPPLIIFGSVVKFSRDSRNISSLANHIASIKNHGPSKYLLVSGLIGIEKSRSWRGRRGRKRFHTISYILCAEDGNKYILCDSNYEHCIDLTLTQIEERYTQMDGVINIESITFIFRRFKF